MARAVGPVVGEDRAVAELVPLEVEPVRRRAVVLDDDVEEVARLIALVQRDAEPPAVSRKLRGVAVLRHAVDGEFGEVERDLADVRGPRREDDLGLGRYLVACVGDGKADAVLLRVERRLARVVVAGLRVCEKAEEQRQRPESFELWAVNSELPDFDLHASLKRATGGAAVAIKGWVKTLSAVRVGVKRREKAEVRAALS